jgi:hypothetical protein
MLYFNMAQKLYLNVQPKKAQRLQVILGLMCSSLAMG